MKYKPRKELDDTIQLLEMLLCFQQWTRRKQFWKRGDKASAEGFQDSIKFFLEYLQDTAQ